MNLVSNIIVFLLFIGAFCIFFYSIRRAVWLKKNGCKVLATVTDSDYFKDLDGLSYYHFRAIYLDEDKGKLLTFDSRHMFRVKEGDPMWIYYDPNNPKRFSFVPYHRRLYI